MRQKINTEKSEWSQTINATYAALDYLNARIEYYPEIEATSIGFVDAQPVLRIVVKPHRRCSIGPVYQNVPTCIVFMKD